MPIELSKLITTPEQWDAMDHDEKLRRIREGHVSPNLLKKIRQEGDEELTEALNEYLRQRPDPLKSIFEQFKTPTLSDRLANLSAAANRPLYGLPRVSLRGPVVPTPEEMSSYDSAEKLIDRLKQRYEAWIKQLPENVQPVIYLMLSNGAAIPVLSISQEGHNGVVIDGLIDGVPCMIVTHQTNLQLLCVAETIVEQSERRTIGFHNGRGDTA